MNQNNFPILAYNYNPMSNTMQRSQSQLYDRTRGPYGVRFEEMDSHRRGGQRQYKDDLEYLINLKNSEMYSMIIKPIDNKKHAESILTKFKIRLNPLPILFTLKSVIVEPYSGN